MDPLTHIVVGRAVVAVARRDRQPSSGIGVAAVLGALSPDIDIVVGFTGWDRYLRVHQAGTHSLAGALAMAFLTACVVRLCTPRSHAGALLGAATAGAMSHLALDLVSGARIAAGWPLVDGLVSLPLVAMAEPWLVGICVAGLLAGWPGRVPMRRTAWLVVITMSLFLAFKAVMLTLALRRTELPMTTPSAVEARWGSLTEWRVYERSADTVRASRISSSGPPAVVIMSEPAGTQSPLVESSRRLETVRNFLAVHEFAFPAVETNGGGGTSVLWSDLRYCSPAPRSDSIACGVWAGGVFDRSGRILTQEVKVGRLVQTRPPPG